MTNYERLEEARVLLFSLANSTLSLNNLQNLASEWLDHEPEQELFDRMSPMSRMLEEQGISLARNYIRDASGRFNGWLAATAEWHATGETPADALLNYARTKPAKA